MTIPRFWVEVVRNMDGWSLDVDGEIVVVAGNEVEAAALVLRLLGGGYADVVEVSPPDSVSVDVDAVGFVKGTSFLSCTLVDDALQYDARFRC